MKSSIRQVLLMFGVVAALAAPAAAAPESGSERELRDAMRKVWADHVIWTREYVVAALAGTPDADAAARRLMKNQEQIGGAIVPYYGKAAGDTLTTLLKEHITIAVELVNAAKIDNKAAFGDADKRWKRNASDIATFLAGANPNWPVAALTDAMNMHLETTTREVVARLQKKYDEDVVAFDAVFDHMMHMADVLSAGIVKQFPDRFRG